MIQKEAKLNDREALVELMGGEKTPVKLHNGKTVKIGFIRGDTQDKLDNLIIKYERFKQSLKPVKQEEGKEPEYSQEDLNKGNKYTRRFYAKCAAAILINSFCGMRLYWWLKWRLLYYFAGWNGDDYLNVIMEAKKKATEQQYSLAMVFLMDMTTTWTTMTKKEAEEYRHELELAKEAQSLKNSQASDSH